MQPNPVMSVGVSPSEIVDAYHKLYYHSGAWKRNTYLGYKIQQCPMDLHLYQELVYRLRPPFIIQTGIADGGSLLFFATLLDLCRMSPEAIVIGIDVELSPAARTLDHPRIRIVVGSSTETGTLDRIEAHLPAAGGMVVLDSDHSYKHVSRELKLYRDFVAPNSYLVLEDTNINGHPVKPKFGPGPAEALSDFLAEDASFARDEDLWAKNLFSFHQHGWLRKLP